MSKCEDCDGKGWHMRNGGPDFEDCDSCDGTGVHKPRETIRLQLDLEQQEAFLDFIDDFPVVIRTFLHYFPADQVCSRAMILKDEIETGEIEIELTDIDRAILKAAVEKSDWLEPYEGQSDESRNHQPRRLEVLRACAAKLETVGIEVDVIAG